MSGPNFYNQNARRRYPLDDAATAETDAGDLLPGDILVDCYVQFPSTAGSYLFVSSVYASPNVVSLTLLASDQPGRGTACAGATSSQTPTAFTPIAAVTVKRSELEEGRQYALNAMYPGVGGWVVFGPCRQAATFNGVFTSVSQSQLAARVCRSYEPLPIPSMGLLYQNPALTGLVRISAGNDITVRKVQREIDGVVRDVLAIALDNRPDSNTLETYKGPCQGRPESGSCLMPPIQTINEVTPDCTGNVEIELVTDCGDLVAAPGGILVDYCLGLADACTNDRGMPVDGKLPNDHDDYCEEDGGWSSEEIEGTDGVFFAYNVDPASSQLPCVTIPYEEDFQDGEASDFSLHSGEWTIADGFYKATNSGINNIALFTGCNFPELLGNAIGVEVLLPLVTGGEPNGGLIFDFKESDDCETYYVAQFDKSKAALTLKFWNGRHVVVIGRANRVPLRFNATYAIVVLTEDAGSYVTVTCELREGHLNGTRLARISFNSERLKSGFGYVGLQAFHSQAYFLRFALGTFTTPITSSQEANTSSVSQTEECDLPLQNVLGYWSFENGDLSDDVGNADFVAYGEKNVIPGPHGNTGLSFPENSFIETESTENFPIGDGSFTVAGHFLLRELPTEKTIVCAKSRGRRIEWMVYIDRHGIYGVLSADGLSHIRVAADNAAFGEFPLDTWIHFNFWYNREERAMYFEINGRFQGRTFCNLDMAITDFPINVARKPIEWLRGVPQMAIAKLAVLNVALSEIQRECLYQTGIDRTQLGGYVSNPSSGAAVPAPFCFWPLNEAGLAAREDLYSRYNLRVTGATGIPSTTGLLDGAANMVPASSILYSSNLPSTRELFPGTVVSGSMTGLAVSFSLGGWIRGTASASTDKCLAGIWMNSGAGRVYGLFMTARGYKSIVSFVGYDDGPNSEYDEIAEEGVRENGWRHVMLVFDATSHKVTTYFNGKSAPTSVGEITYLPGGSQPFTLGGSSWFDGTHPEGYGFSVPTALVYDDWGFWRGVALTEEQILTIVNNGLGWQPDV